MTRPTKSNRQRTYHHHQERPRVNFRLVFIFLVIFGGFMAVTAKLFVVQVIDHEYYFASGLKM